MDTKIKLEFSTFKNKFETIKREAQLDFFQTIVKQVLNKNQLIKEIRIIAYTPYFNDGEECTYQLSHIGVKFDLENLNTKILDNLKTDFNWIYQQIIDENDYVDSRDFNPSYTKLLLGEAFDDLYKSLDENSDMLLLIFGDHNSITISRDQIMVEEYDHE